MDRVDALTALALAVGLAVVAVVDYALSAVGLDAVGSMFWLLGYGSIVVAGWYVWIRPLDIGAGSADPVWRERSRDDEREG